MIYFPSRSMAFKMGLSWDLAWFSHHWCIPSIWTRTLTTFAGFVVFGSLHLLEQCHSGLGPTAKVMAGTRERHGLEDVWSIDNTHKILWTYVYLWLYIILYDIVIRRFQGISGFEAVWTCSKRTYVILSQWDSYWFKFCRWHRNPDVGQTSDPEREIPGAIIDNSLVAGLEHFYFSIYCE